VAGW